LEAIRGTGEILLMWRCFKTSFSDVDQRLLQIWMYLIISMALTILTLYGISHVITDLIGKTKRKNNLFERKGKLFEDIGRAFQYVFGVILSQGNF
jgi:hypothetical protein